MRLTELRLTSFRSYSDTILNTAAPRVLFAGENGSGKSTLREAVRWLLTGHCGITDARGAGAELLAPEHTSLIQVAATTDLGVIARRRNNGITEFVVGDAKGEPSLQQAALYAKLNTTPEFVDAVLETEHFLQMHHADAKSLVLSLLNVKVPVDGEMLSLDELDARHKAAMVERKDAKARLKVHTVPPLPAEKFPPVAEVETQLAKLRSELAVHQQDVGILIGRRAELQKQVEALPALVVQGDPADLRARIDALHVQADELVTLINAAPEPIETGAVNFIERSKVLRSRKEALDKFQPSEGCVLDPDFPCPQTRRKVMNRIRAIDVELASIPETVVKPPTGDPLAAQKARLTQINHDIPVLTERLQKAEETIAENKRRMEERDALNAQIASLAEPPADKVAAMETLQARIGKGEFVLRAAQAYWDTLSRRDAEVTKHAALEADVDRLEALCDVLGPTGARVDALRDAIGRFETAINASTTLFGWQVSFVLDPWGVSVNGRDLRTYSESEQFRIGIAVQLAIAHVSGLSFAIIDRLDMLDAKNRNLATKMILAAPVGQVFILSTREESQALPNGSGFIAHRLVKQGGRTSAQETVGA